MNLIEVKFFELSNHLSNVLVTVTDRKNGVAQSIDTTLVDYYLPDIASANDYYPFGMTMPGRSVHSDKYRYGFNGQEKSTEVDQHGNSMTAEFWQYDARLGRRWNVDPVVKEHESPYASLANNPIGLIDFNGADTTLPTAAGSGSVTLPSDVENVQTYQPGYTYSLASDLKKPVPVKGGELRSFSSGIGLGVFTARWEEGNNGEVRFLGYQNDKGESYNDAADRHNREQKFFQDVAEFGEYLKDPFTASMIIAFPL